MNSKKFAKNLIDFIYNSPTAFHAVSTSKELLDANGFIELESCKMWDIKVGGKYYITKNSSAIVAFTVNSDNIEKEGFRIIGSHSDSPSFRIKPNAEIEAEKTYLKAGFKREGVLKDAVKDGDQYADDILMAILEDEWRELK